MKSQEIKNWILTKVKIKTELKSMPICKLQLNHLPRIAFLQRKKIRMRNEFPIVLLNLISIDSIIFIDDGIEDVCLNLSFVFIWY